MVSTSRVVREIIFKGTLLVVSASWLLTAQEAAATAPAIPDQEVLRIAREVHKQIVTLPQYGVFDYIHFAIKGRTVILRGQASRPTLKSACENVVKKIEGVEAVENEIDVLPLSPNDDRIRAAVYARIYGNPALSKYTSNRGRVGFNGPGRIPGGITNDPPIGWHGIHIIVKNGNVTLRGTVINSADMTIAGMQANQTPGVFSVDNDLVVQKDENPKKQKAKS